MTYKFYMSVGRFIVFIVVELIIFAVFEIYIIPYLKERIKK